MKGVRLLGNCQVEITELPDPVPAADQVLVRVTASGICGGEVHAYKGDKALDANPGHEVAGIVEDANGHPQWKKGDPLGIWTIQGCGYCRHCRAGNNDYCANVQIPRATHSEFTCSRATAMRKLTDDVDAPLAGGWSEGGSCAPDPRRGRLGHTIFGGVGQWRWGLDRRRACSAWKATGGTICGIRRRSCRS